jgi:hypothetical protein
MCQRKEKEEGEGEGGGGGGEEEEEEEEEEGEQQQQKQNLCMLFTGLLTRCVNRTSRLYYSLLTLEILYIKIRNDYLML